MRTVHFFKHLLLLPVVIAAFGAIVMLLWNWLIPGIFGWAAINYWQALGLLVLLRILFGSVGKHWMRAGMYHHHHANPIRDKWMNMTPEERKEFVKNRQFHDFAHGFRGRCRRDCRRDFSHENETGKQD